MHQNKEDRQRKAKALDQEREERILTEAAEIRAMRKNYSELTVEERLVIAQADIFLTENARNATQAEFDAAQQQTVPSADVFLQKVIHEAVCFMPSCRKKLTFQTARILPGSAILRSAETEGLTLPVNVSFMEKLASLDASHLQNTLCCPECGRVIADLLAEQNPSPASSNDIRTHRWRSTVEDWAQIQSSILQEEHDRSLSRLTRTCSAQESKLQSLRAELKELKTQKTALETAKIAAEAAEAEKREKTLAHLIAMGVVDKSSVAA